MDQFPPALLHGQLEQILPDIFFVTGATETVLMNARRQFSRNMTAVRHGNALTLINSIRLDDAGLAQLDALGRVAHVVKIGSLRGRDDAFYEAHYGATFWGRARGWCTSTASMPTASDAPLASASALAPGRNDDVGAQTRTRPARAGPVAPPNEIPITRQSPEEGTCHRVGPRTRVACS
jgi:hypothetical protein